MSTFQGTTSRQLALLFRVAAAFAVLAVFAALPASFLLAAETPADPKNGGAVVKPKGDKKSEDLPLAKVVMFNAGVGYFEHRGKVQGDAAVELKFNVSDINDLLKSMVLEDQGGGRISTITYGSQDPITKTLQTFAVDLTSNPTLGQILNQMRGEQVRVDAPNNITGVILGVEIRRKEAGKDLPPVEIEMLNLLTDEGLRSVPLDSVGRIKLLDEKLDAELRQALKVLAMSHSTDKKTVTLNFLGNGQRAVRVGYIQETPVWKTSYRLVLSDEDAPFLQGWAIVENTTEEDWSKVGLTLVSGRPISFIMDLYKPLYVQRPVVEPELYASLRPQTYGQDLAAADAEFKAAAAAPGKPAAPMLAARALQFGGKGGGNRDRGEQANMKQAEALEKNAAMEIRRGVQSQAQGGDVGELFQYVIATPVTLPRHESAMLPIVNESVKGEKLSIYNANVQAKHPLNGFRLNNSTGLHLMQGPITVFDGGTYAGDAKIDDLQPGTNRLISYALDLDTEVASESKGEPQHLVSVRVAKGVLITDYRYTRGRDYTIKNSGKKAKTVLIEYPLDPNYKLIAPKEPAEKTRDLYRFAVTAEPGKPAKLTVEEERIVRQQVALNNLDDHSVNIYLSQPEVSDKVKAVLKEVVKRKRAIQDIVQQRQNLDEQTKVIGQEQDRIRQNMAQLDRTTDLYKKYVTKFSNQEDQIEKLRDQVKGLLSEEIQLRKILDDYLLNLELT